MCSEGGPLVLVTDSLLHVKGFALALKVCICSSRAAERVAVHVSAAELHCGLFGGWRVVLRCVFAACACVGVFDDGCLCLRMRQAAAVGANCVLVTACPKVLLSPRHCCSAAHLATPPTCVDASKCWCSVCMHACDCRRP